MTSKEQLHANVIHWVNVLEGNQDEIRDLYPPEEMDALTCSEYVTEHILDVEYTVSGSGDVLGASYLMAFGGPTVRIDTRHGTVVGTWGHDRYELPYTDNIDLHSLEESFAESFSTSGR